ncbi:hypothetical protein BDZ94DRAFT_1311858 [Collybia nuda]|uniref:DUF6533 domain-containing protein n=1 Tax=Collybia nuda TaxID=64659 RepID=A0A9P5Y2E7_9AGAR|nr:hypothetical protein BDZ94DRAFT_1311858 [Collybia nuda]
MEVKPDLKTIVTAGWHLRIVSSFELVALTILFYDFLLTFKNEVHYIWEKKKTPLSILYLANRYFTPVAFIFSIYAMFSVSWTYDLLVKSITTAACINYLKGVWDFPNLRPAQQLSLVHAIFRKNWLVTSVPCLICAVQLAMMSYVLANSGRAAQIIPPSSIAHGCVLFPDPKLGLIVLLFVIPSLVFDATVMILLSFGLYFNASSRSMYAVSKLLFRDGILYFSVVFLTNLIWVVFGALGPSDLQTTLALFSTASKNYKYYDWTSYPQPQDALVTSKFPAPGPKIVGLRR